MPGASKLGTIDPMGKSRVYVNELLETVPAGSAEAAFVFKRGDLENFREKRTKLGLAKNDEALRTMLASRKVSIESVERRMAALKAELAALTEEVDKASKTTPAAAAPSADVEALMAGTRAELDAQAKAAGIADPESLPNKQAVAEAIVAKAAAN